MYEPEWKHATFVVRFDLVLTITVLEHGPVIPYEVRRWRVILDVYQNLDSES